MPNGLAGNNASERPQQQPPQRSRRGTTSSGGGLGNLIRMRNLPNDQLPTHPELSKQPSSPDIQTFAAHALNEAEIFMTQHLANFETKSTDKSSPPSKALVTLSSRENYVPTQQAGAADVEHWFARTSLHENKAEEGTAEWEEFDAGLRVDHSQNEMSYTPDVQDAHEVMSWDAELEKVGRKVEGGWEDVHASVMEMVHKIPAPLNNRVFPVLVMTAKKVSPAPTFLVVQIPVATQGLPNAKYHNVPKMTGGMYTSIERGELVEEGRRVQWQMATASDAKGVLPMWAQKMGVPGAVVKDVGLFIQWVAERRGKGKV